MSLVCVSILAHIAVAQKQSGKLDALKRYAGTDSVKTVLNNPTVKTQLANLLGKKRSVLDHYITVRGDINLIDGNLVIEGCAPHECDQKSGIIIIELQNGNVHAAIFEIDSVSIYSKLKDYEILPFRLREWTSLRANDSSTGNFSYRFSPPSNVDELAEQTPVKPNKSKIKTITGLLCNQGYGSGLGFRAFRTPSGLFEFSFSYDVPTRGLKKNREKIGAEYIVKFTTDENGEHTVESFTFTGNVKKVQPCEEE